MKIGRSTGNPTRTQQARFDAIKELGCICCLRDGQLMPAEIHHLTIGGKHGQKRRGHDFTIGLCSWHHRGVIEYGTTALYAERYGPSYALQPRLFRETYGQDDALLARQNEAIAGRMIE